MFRWFCTNYSNILISHELCVWLALHEMSCDLADGFVRGPRGVSSCFRPDPVSLPPPWPREHEPRASSLEARTFKRSYIIALRDKRLMHSSSAKSADLFLKPHRIAACPHRTVILIPVLANNTDPDIHSLREKNQTGLCLTSFKLFPASIMHRLQGSGLDKLVCRFG